jgi:hypothetical protein
MALRSHVVEAAGVSEVFFQSAAELGPTARSNEARQRAGPCLVKMFQLFQQSCCLHWARHSKKCSSEPDCGLLYVVQTAFGRVVECGRVNCA